MLVGETKIRLYDVCHIKQSQRMDCVRGKNENAGLWWDKMKGKEKGLQRHCCNPLYLLVSRRGVEPRTY